jgi:hypothetical protein
MVNWLVGSAWLTDGHLFLIALFAIMVLCGAYALLMLVELAMQVAEMRNPPTRAPRYWEGPIPPLSKAKQEKVRRLHQAMAEAGVFAPEVPDPALAFAAFAVDKQPVDWIGVLQSLGEADFYHPDCDPAGWSDNLWWDGIPPDWRESRQGKVVAFLWEDENLVSAWVNADALERLGEASGNATPWLPLDEEAAADLCEWGRAQG